MRDYFMTESDNQAVDLRRDTLGQSRLTLVGESRIRPHAAVWSR